MRWIFKYNEQSKKYLERLLKKKIKVEPQPWLHVAVKTMSERNPWCGFVIYVWDTRQIQQGGEYRSSADKFTKEMFTKAASGMSRALDNRQPLKGGRKDVNEFFEFGEFDASKSSYFEGKERVKSTALYEKRSKKRFDKMKTGTESGPGRNSTKYVIACQLDKNLRWHRANNISFISKKDAENFLAEQVDKAKKLGFPLNTPAYVMIAAKKRIGEVKVMKLDDLTSGVEFGPSITKDSMIPGLESSNVDNSKFYICLFANNYVYVSVKQGFDTKQEADAYVKERVDKAKKTGLTKSTPNWLAILAGLTRSSQDKVQILKGSEIQKLQTEMKSEHDKEVRNRKTTYSKGI